MRAQLFERSSRRPAPRTTGQLLRQNFHGTVHADGENLFDIGQVGIGRVVLDIGAKTANRSFHRGHIVRMLAHKARQIQQI